MCVGVLQKGSHLLGVSDSLKTTLEHYQGSDEEYPKTMAVELVVHLDHGDEVGVGATPLLVVSSVNSAACLAAETVSWEHRCLESC